MFYNRTQANNEPVDSFIKDEKLLARDWGFPPDIVDEMIGDRLVYFKTQMTLLVHMKSVQSQLKNI